ncbi:MAG: tRNA (guanosine(37)-N1)-methyltransferase TrmD [Candidatus Komeilibacteria bacterium]
MRFDLLTIFPHSLDSYFNESILKRGQAKKLITIKTHDIRSVTKDKHHTVDDKPYGGGAGMVMKVDIVHKALLKIYKKTSKTTRVILLSPRGDFFTQNEAKRLAKYQRLILISGHYESIDSRIEDYVDEIISIGPYVLTGGELPAACIIDSVSRLITGVVGKAESIKDESYQQIAKGQTQTEYPHYTRPEVYRGKKVPTVLLSGNHQKIAHWRQQQKKTSKLAHD